jgi:hypothetical protein
VFAEEMMRLMLSYPPPPGSNDEQGRAARPYNGNRRRP